MRCPVCGGEMGTGGCYSTWKHPPITVQCPLVPYASIPPDGPGSHAWDLREMQAQRERADKAEARAERAERQAKALAKALDSVLNQTRIPDPVTLGPALFHVDRIANICSAALSAYRGGDEVRGL